MTMYGADPLALRELGRRFAATAQKLEQDATGLGGAVESSPWGGPDAESFKNQWRDTHSPKLRLSAQSLLDAAAALNRNADEQERASDTRLGGEHDKTRPTPPSAVPWSAQGILDVAKGSVSFALKAIKAWKGAQLFGSFLSASKLASISPAARSALAFIPGEAAKLVTGAPAWLGKLGPLSKVATTVGKYAGTVGALWSIGSGIHQAVNPQHEGWRGVGDRIAGGLSVVSGVSTLLLMSPLAATPAGPVIAAVAVGAGLVSAAWNLGNTIYDNWDNITKFGADVWDGAKNFASGAASVVHDVVSDPLGSMKKAANKVGSFFKGIFG